MTWYNMCVKTVIAICVHVPSLDYQYLLIFDMIYAWYDIYFFTHHLFGLRAGGLFNTGLIQGDHS